VKLIFEKSSKLLNDFNNKILNELDEEHSYFGLSKSDKNYLIAFGKGLHP
jgi:hypothetical protein